MELPMLKAFTEYQELWKDVWRDIFAIVLDEDIDSEPVGLQVELPQMLKDDLSRLGQFLMGLHQVFPEIQVPEILQSCLVALGINNVEEVMDTIEAKRKELERNMGKQLPPPTAPKGRTAPATAPVSEAATAAAMNRLALAIETLR
jgi:hypothetical protein